MTKEKAIFLDRDGVVNELVYFPEQGIIDSPFTPDQFCLCPGVPFAIKRFQNKGYKVIIVSNQPGIAKGHITQNNFDRIDANMKAQLASRGRFAGRHILLLASSESNYRTIPHRLFMP